MNKDHKWYDLAKQWMEGAAIQYRVCGSEWTDISNPLWEEGENFEYRVKPSPIKWQDERRAFEAGKTIEFRNKIGNRWSEWRVTDCPVFFDMYGIEYRVQPKPSKWEKEKEAFARGETIECRIKVGKNRSEEWTKIQDPLWLESPGIEYRVKPDDIIVFAYLTYDTMLNPRFTNNYPPNICITWSYNGELQSIKVLSKR